MSAKETHKDAVTAAIFAAAWADGSVGDQERVALTRILGLLGYSQPEIEERVASAMAGPCPDLIEVPDDEPTAVEILRYALAVMLADALLTQDEVNYLVKLAAHLKVGSAMLSALGREAEVLLAQVGPDTASALGRVETLLPKSHPELPRIDPQPRGSSGDRPNRKALTGLVQPSCDIHDISKQ